MKTRSVTLRRPLLVRDYMRRDVVVASDTMSVRELARLLVEGGFGGAPVVNAEQQPVGVVSARDALEILAYERGDAAAATTVREIMTPATLTVRPEATIGELSHFLLRADVHRVLVVDDGRLQGIISAMDVVRAMADENPDAARPVARRHRRAVSGVPEHRAEPD
jgi:CBS domain-containing protein